MLAASLEDAGYHCRPLNSEADMQAAAAIAGKKLALVDTSGFGSNVWRLCEKLQHMNTAFIVLSPQEMLTRSSHATQYGAVSVMQKPVAKKALMQLIAGFTSEA
ncbi:response regulator receiver protein [Salinivibrio sp. ES.052]|uniref:response regulator receiver protein n=1 Tax=Salinivibrio sp. ES.052 TaxID=1882823 RepID=UPI0011151664|nr:response regulator receiver protein [Salinivibrio sp. ES.052]